MWHWQLRDSPEQSHYKEGGRGEEQTGECEKCLIKIKQHTLPSQQIIVKPNIQTHLISNLNPCHSLSIVSCNTKLPLI